MADVIRMPRLSDTMTEGVILKWYKQVGDAIKAGEVIADVETDKATMELENYYDAYLLHIEIKEGQSVPVEGVIAIVGKQGENIEAALSAAKQSAQTAISNTTEALQNEAASNAITNNNNTNQNNSSSINSNTTQTKPHVTLPAGVKEIRMPLLSDTMTEGKILSWAKNVGDKVGADDVLADVETDKATMEVVGYEEGYLLHQGVPANGIAKVNDLIALIGPKDADVSAYLQSDYNNPNASAASQKNTSNTQNVQTETTAAQPNANQTATSTSNNTTASSADRIKASPLARAMALVKGFDLKLITGSGDGGRIVKTDIDNYKPQTSAQTTTSSMAPKETVAFSSEKDVDIPLTSIRKTIAKRLTESAQTIPHFYLTVSINMDEAIATRSKLNEISETKISFNDMVIKASAMALRKHPDINSSWMGDFIRVNGNINVGTALALPDGLIVPVIKNADKKSLATIAAETKMLYAKARDKKIQLDEITGNTFTVSNLGMLDVDNFTAIINPPDSAILAVGAIKEQVVKKDAAFTTVQTMMVTMSCDHRVIDGATGATFLQTFKRFMETPAAMLL